MSWEWALGLLGLLPAVAAVIGLWLGRRRRRHLDRILRCG
jgi:LPXTG-motif cell wall-anchored protein